MNLRFEERQTLNFEAVHFLFPILPNIVGSVVQVQAITQHECSSFLSSAPRAFHSPRNFPHPIIFRHVSLILYSYKSPYLFPYFSKRLFHSIQTQTNTNNPIQKSKCYIIRLSRLAGHSFSRQ